MEDAPLAVHVEFNSTLGAAFLGHFVTAILYGITSLQTYLYFKWHHTDPPLLKYLVFVLWIFDSLHVSLITYSMYFYMVTNYADPFIVERPVWSIMAMIMVSNVSNIIVRGVFSHRLWKLSGRSLIFPLSVGVLSLYVAGDGFYFAIRGLQSASYQDVHHFSWSLYVGFAFEVVVDGTITVSQCLLLRRLRTGIRRTDSVISVLMLYSINTGLFPSVCALLCLITFTVLPHMFVYFAFYFVLSKFYVNSLLANLNARTTILEPISPRAGERHCNNIKLPYSVSSGTCEADPASAQFSTVVDPLMSTSNMPRISVAEMSQSVH
ncbi:uncharacterized protein LAESUDRAFT_705224 [Laetiporus sulphureus 93-53]|uniref:DUF6534 domain-containing protein n=1 Tax=Laetiporus sulphureus 93-53 TaxID=1314785 RepID=A0A165CM45_9APHY|nr:uncharacterized protein LAESUDRAFT_705224 [Laetiporus sulphureus 93-53]KZT03057.1 hypothetical protein LAESUDRAFT_705224 [Laetiporus sulphureus 93-53]